LIETKKIPKYTYVYRVMSSVYFLSPPYSGRGLNKQQKT